MNTFKWENLAVHRCSNDTQFNNFHSKNYDFLPGIWEWIETSRWLAAPLAPPVCIQSCRWGGAGWGLSGSAWGGLGWPQSEPPHSSRPRGWTAKPLCLLHPAAAKCQVRSQKNNTSEYMWFSPLKDSRICPLNIMIISPKTLGDNPFISWQVRQGKTRMTLNESVLSNLLIESRTTPVFYCW